MNKVEFRKWLLKNNFEVVEGTDDELILWEMKTDRRVTIHTSSDENDPGCIINIDRNWVNTTYEEFADLRFTGQTAIVFLNGYTTIVLRLDADMADELEDW